LLDAAEFFHWNMVAEALVLSGMEAAGNQPAQCG